MATANVSCASHVSEEEDNYLRMHLLVAGTSPKAVRILFDKEFHPLLLNSSIKKGYGTQSDLKMKRVINAAQWNLLFPRSGKNLANFTEPAGGYDKLPCLTDTTPMADLARIRHYRNQLAHFKDGKMKTAAKRKLGGPDMVEECKELRTKHLDQSTVPWNLKVQFRQILDQWKKDDVNFVETRAAKHVLEFIRKHSCVTVTASSGVGKTATLRHKVLKMIGNGYDSLLVTNPHEIVQFFNPNQKTLFVIDDFCGTFSINQSENKERSVDRGNRWKNKKHNREHFKACRLDKKERQEREKDSDQFITIVPPKYHQMYIQRMVNDLSCGKVIDVFNNINMDIPKFRRRFLCYLNTLDISYQRQLAQTCDDIENDTVLLQCFFEGDIPFIQWCLFHCVDINLCRYGGVSPLYVSSQEGHTEVVKMLLDKRADINKCKDE
ncbi:unnamed protein product [Mytilus coruscus]|uniref:Uncharacterized protein n=1 Tax=Mytilus coruscus TaxID=42192 RepID=A0A6J7ZWU8_MYTCO|nr:unnamed protein product [Mytilus coruscus]